MSSPQCNVNARMILIALSGTEMHTHIHLERKQKNILNVLYITKKREIQIFHMFLAHLNLEFKELF